MASDIQRINCIMTSNIPVLLPFGKTIYQSANGQSINSDTKFIVDTIINEVPETPKTVLELGSGNGIISIMLAHYRPNWQIAGIEIQPHLVELAKQNSKLAEVKVEFCTVDIKTYTSKTGFDLIVANPPYFPALDGRISPNEERAISRHEIKCDMLDVLNCIKRNMIETAFVIYPNTRFTELEKKVKKVDLKIAAKFIFHAEDSKFNELSVQIKKSKILVKLIHI